MPKPERMAACPADGTSDPAMNRNLTSRETSKLPKTLQIHYFKRVFENDFIFKKLPEKKMQLMVTTNPDFLLAPQLKTGFVLSDQLLPAVIKLSVKPQRKNTIKR